ncbi:MAG: S46 family peptidase, partial [Flavipsychrobacter sp.]|nr:S46 family peptidase [Flavipsychrobacter sp.]
KSLGKFGGDTDNWMWPRHTADFSMFRVYAGADNEPAAYSSGNVPYKPKHFLPVDASGQKEGDYAMIMGYPGRTNRYEVSYGVKLAIDEVNPSIVNIRDKRLAIMRKHMKGNKATYLKLTSLYSRVANYWKYFIGQTEQLKRLGVVAQKQEAEDDFAMWARERDVKNGDLMDEFETIYEDYTPYAKHVVYYGEAIRASALTKLAASMEPMYKAMKDGKDQETISKMAAEMEKGLKAFYKEYDAGTEKELFAEMTKMFYNNVPKAQHPSIYEEIQGKYKGNYAAYTNYVFGKSFMANPAKLKAFLKAPKMEQLESDPAFVYATSFSSNYNGKYKAKVDEFNNTKKDLHRRYIKALMKMNPGKNYYPDANSTMRVTYGKVDGYSSSEGRKFNYFTTLDQTVAKYKPGNEEFDLPKELIALNKKRDYGVWADADGSLHTCFITDNDITGGNSGSPVINGNGELIGLAFDGNWEAMSGDIAFDKKYKRTICVDIRFVLFLVEKLGKAPNIINEMEVYK